MSNEPPERIIWKGRVPVKLGSIITKPVEIEYTRADIAEKAIKEAVEATKTAIEKIIKDG